MAQKETQEYESENLPDELSDWIAKSRDEGSNRKFRTDYVPQSIALGPDGMYCVTCKAESSFSSNLDKSLPVLARILKDATEAKATAGIVSSHSQRNSACSNEMFLHSMLYSVHIPPANWKPHRALKRFGHPTMFCKRRTVDASGKFQKGLLINSLNIR